MPRFWFPGVLVALAALVPPAIAQQIATPAAERDFWCASAFQRVASGLRATDAPSADRLLMFAGALRLSAVAGISAGVTQADIDGFQSWIEARVSAELVKGVTPSHTFDDCLVAGEAALRTQTSPAAIPAAPPAAQ